MAEKTSVSILHEYCAKNKLGNPSYEFIDSEEGSFICEISLMDWLAHGTGRSKRDAKHFAAANLIKKVRKSNPDIVDVPQVEPDELPHNDMIVTLRDYCVRNHHPLPVIEIKQQGGTPDAPEFVVVCTLASIQRYGISSKKKDARQKAAFQMLCAISEDFTAEKMQVATLDDKTKEVEEERYKKFNTYRELTESKTNVMPGIRLCDRHNFFFNFYDALKAQARNVLNTAYESRAQQVHDLFEALKLTPTVTPMAVENSLEEYLFITLDCEYDVVFAGPQESLYRNIVEYFTDMLQ